MLSSFPKCVHVLFSISERFSHISLGDGRQLKILKENVCEVLKYNAIIHSKENVRILFCESQMMLLFLYSGGKLCMGRDMFASHDFDAGEKKLSFSFNGCKLVNKLRTKLIVHTKNYRLSR